MNKKSKKFLEDFRSLRDSIKEKFSGAEIVKEIKEKEEKISKNIKEEREKADLFHNNIREILNSNREENKEFKDLFGQLDKLRKVQEEKQKELEFDRTSVRLEATFQNISGVICDYEMSDGILISIYSLTIEDFLIEKINTYLKRFKVKDLWDIFFLLKNSKISNKKIEKLIKNYKKPIDENNLKVIIIEGIVPSSDEMFNYIKNKWENKCI